MRFRSTLVYFLAALALVVFYFYETRKDKEATLAKEEAKRLLSLKPDQLEKMALRRGKDFIEVEKRPGPGPGAWELVSPVRTPTDAFALSGLTKKLSELKYERLVSDNAGDLAEFGLREPSFTVAYKAGREEGMIAFGSRSPIGQGVYATTGDGKRVYLIAEADKEALDRSLFDLRDKKLLTLETDRVNHILIGRGGTEWALDKRDDRWLIVGEENLKIAREKVELFLRPIVWAEALSFEKEEARDLRPYGLHRPAARVVLSDGSRAEEMIFGETPKEGKEDRIYAMVKGKPQVVTVRKRLLENLPTEKAQVVETADPKKEGAD